MWKALRRVGRAGRPCARVRRPTRAPRNPGRQAPRLAGAHALALIRWPSACADLVTARLQAPGPTAPGSDLTYLRSWEGLVFFSFVLDAYSRRVLGWQLASDMRTTQL